jgi:hypothetical protein
VVLKEAIRQVRIRHGAERLSAREAALAMWRRTLDEYIDRLAAYERAKADYDAAGWPKLVQLGPDEARHKLHDRVRYRPPSIDLFEAILLGADAEEQLRAARASATAAQILRDKAAASSSPAEGEALREQAVAAKAAADIEVEKAAKAAAEVQARIAAIIAKQRLGL